MNNIIVTYENKNKEKELLKYYKIHSMGYFEDEEDEHSFMDINKAINYAKMKNGNYFEPYDLYQERIIIKDNNELENKSICIGKIPNQRIRKISYYVLGKEEENVLKIIKSYSYYTSFNPKTIVISTKEDNKLGIYQITVTLNNENNLEYSYKLDHLINQKNKNRILTKNKNNK